MLSCFASYVCFSFASNQICILAFCDVDMSAYLILCSQDMKSKFHLAKAKHEANIHETQMKSLMQDAYNQHTIMKHKAAAAAAASASHAAVAEGDDEDSVSANSMSPHLSMHSTRGQEAGRGRHPKVQEVWTSILIKFLSSKNHIRQILNHMMCVYRQLTGSKRCLLTRLRLSLTPTS